MSEERHLTCPELVELVTEYLEGTLPPAESARFETHLGFCGDCRDYLEQMRQTVRLAGRLSVESIPAPARQRLLAAFRSWKRPG